MDKIGVLLTDLLDLVKKLSTRALCALVLASASNLFILIRPTNIAAEVVRKRSGAAALRTFGQEVAVARYLAENGCPDVARVE